MVPTLHSPTRACRVAAIFLTALGGCLASGSAMADQQERTSAFEYHPVTGLLIAEVTEPDKPEYCVRTQYSYDAYGNKTGRTTLNCDGSPANSQFAMRSETSVYGASGPYTVPGAFSSQTSNAAAHASTMSHDGRWGQPISHTGPNGLSTNWTYDDFGRKILEVRADQTRTVWRHCLLVGNPSSNSEGCTRPAATPSDARGYLETEPQGPGGIKNGPYTRMYYDLLGREIRAETESFDGGGAAGLQSAGAIVKDTEYSPWGGAVLRISRPYFLATGSTIAGSSVASGWTEMQYDGIGRPTNVWTHDAQGESGWRRIEYDGLITKERVAVSYRVGSSSTLQTDAFQTSTQLKDPLGRLVWKSEHDASMAYQYDAVGNLVKTVDSVGNQTLITYDPLGRKTALQDPDSGLTTYTYDALGQLKTQQNANQRLLAQATSMAYDVLGRMVSRSQTEFTTTWSYDRQHDGSPCNKGMGKLCEVRTSHGVQRQFTYDALGRPASNQLSIPGDAKAFSSAVTYDSAGRVATQSWPSGMSATFSYTALGFLSEVRNNSGNALLWQAQRMNATGELAQLAYGNGVVSRLSFDPKTGRAAAFQAGTGYGQDFAVTVSGQSYVFDTANNLRVKQDAFGDGSEGTQENFAYDSSARLIFQTLYAPGLASGVRNVRYAYNAIGNLLYKSDAGIYTYGANGSARPHAVQSVGQGSLETSFAYDAAGNMVSSSGSAYRTLTYTSFNLPDASATGGALGANGTRYGWHYDADYRRIKEIRQSASGTRTTWMFHPDAANGLLYEQELSESGATVHRHYLSAGGAAFAVLTTTQSGSNALASPSLAYWHKDYLGSLLATTNASGTVTGRYAYDAFGKRRHRDGRFDAEGSLVPTEDRGFTGHEHLDDIGVIHMNGRLYDPLLGRFMQPDPLIQAPGLIANHNRYSYVLNNPLNATDPSGQFIDWFMALPAAWQALVVAEIAVAARVLGIIDTQTARSILGMAATYWVGGLGATLPNTAAGTGMAAVQAFSAGFVGGMIANPDAAINTGISAALFSAAGSVSDGIDGGLANNSVGRALVHGVAGCVSASAGGGNCGQGALTAGLNKFISSNLPIKGAEARFVAYSVVGGTLSSMGGGKFANGALMGAFQYLFNECGHTKACGREGGYDPSDKARGIMADLRGDSQNAADGCISTGGGPSICIGPGAIRGISSALSSNVTRVVAETIAGKGNFVSQFALTADELLDAGTRFLGKGYVEIGKAGSGVFRSTDGLRQFRIDSNSLAGSHSPGIPHGHLEIFKQGSVKPTTNNHIPFSN